MAKGKAYWADEDEWAKRSGDQIPLLLLTCILLGHRLTGTVTPTSRPDIGA
jgi:hypothetical protein